MDCEKIKEYLRFMDWSKLKKYLDAQPLKGSDEASELLILAYHCDRVVRRRPGDDGVRRNKFLESLSEYFDSAGFGEAASGILEMRQQIAVIDEGYVAIYETEGQLPTATWTAQDRIAAVLVVLADSAKQIVTDMDRSVANAKALVPEPEVLNAEGKRYNPASQFHHLAIAAGNVLMMEAYRNDLFDANDQFVLPELPTPQKQEAMLITGKMLNANHWQQWKSIDETVRFLGGELRLVEGEPDWLGRVVVPEGVKVKKAIEFDMDVNAELYSILATERFDERQRQTFFELMVQTNLQEIIVDDETQEAPLAPAAFISVKEGHAAESLYRALAMPLEKAFLGDISIAEILRGFAVLHDIARKSYDTANVLFPYILEDDLRVRLSKQGMSMTAVDVFMRAATFGRSSRDLYDSPLIRRGSGKLTLFGWTMLFLDLPKVVLSTINRENKEIKDKGKHFEQSVIEFFGTQGFSAKTVEAHRGTPRTPYEYDVVFVWDEYVFIFECKNRGLPGDSPIAVHYFNLEIDAHVKQVQRLRRGLQNFPDILEQHCPAAVGKKRIYCVLHALPFACHPIDDICFADATLIRRFFQSGSLGMTVAPVPNAARRPAIRYEFAQLWAGPRPTAAEFAKYLANPPQLKLAAAHYVQAERAEWLSDSVVVKINEVRREGASFQHLADAMQARSSAPNVSAKKGYPRKIQRRPR